MEEIRELLENYVKAIHSQDESLFRSLWSNEELDTMISITNQYHGIDAIVHDFLIGRIQAAYETIDLIVDEEPVIQMITEDVAKVIFVYHTECIRRETQEAYGIQGVETQIVKKVDGKWKFVHIHYSKS